MLSADVILAILDRPLPYQIDIAFEDNLQLSFHPNTFGKGIYPIIIKIYYYIDIAFRFETIPQGRTKDGKLLDSPPFAKIDYFTIFYIDIRFQHKITSQISLFESQTFAFVFLILSFTALAPSF